MGRGRRDKAESRANNFEASKWEEGEKAKEGKRRRGEERRGGGERRRSRDRSRKSRVHLPLALVLFSRSAGTLGRNSPPA